MQGVRVMASLHFWLRLSLLFLTLRGLWSIGGWIAARRNLTAATPNEGTARAGRMIKPLVMPGFWFTLGCAFIVYWSTGIPPLENVTIMAKRSDAAFQMVNEKGQKFEITFCGDTHVDFQEGEKLQVLSYEQRTGCKSLNGRNLGFIAYTDKDGNRIHFPIPKEIADVR